MRTITASALGIALLGLLAAGPLVAALDPAPPKQEYRRELLVLEVRNCGVCALVRENIQPEYELSPRSREVPLRYVDVTAIDERKLGLTTPVDTLPTIVLMQDGREVDRIAGYVAPNLLLEALDRMIQATE